MRAKRPLPQPTSSTRNGRSPTWGSMVSRRVFPGDQALRVS
ncbi:MAG: hypothetical protein R3A10_06390 [Caldilineaceae bacterium]